MSDLIETLTWACRIAYDTDDSDISPRYSKALELLSDRRALLWALLEEMAGEVVERHDYEDRTVWRLPGSSETLALLQHDVNGRFRFWFSGGWAQESTTQAQAVAMLCAIQEQRKREAGVQDA